MPEGLEKGNRLFFACRKVRNPRKIVLGQSQIGTKLTIEAPQRMERLPIAQPSPGCGEHCICHIVILHGGEDRPQASGQS